MTQHVDNENGPRCWSTEDRSENQLSAGLAPSIAHPSEPVSPHAERFKRAEDDGIIATSRWIGHEAVRDHVERWRIPVMQILAPAFGRILADTDETVLFCWAVFGITGINSDFQPTNNDWSRVYLTPREKACAPRAVSDFKRIVARAVRNVKSAGADIDPEWDGDHAVIATLMLAYGPSIPWDAPAIELAEWVYPPGSTALTVDLKGVRARRDVSLETEYNIVAIRHAAEDNRHGPRKGAPYARGRGRATQARPVTLLDALVWALPQIREAFPRSSSVSQIRTGWKQGKSTATAGGRLRELVRTKLPDVDCPSPATLYRAFEAAGLTP